MNTYFKHRRPLQFNPHPFDIGIFFGVKPGYEDNHFLKKIYTLPHSDQANFYQYHLDYFLNENNHQEQDFFHHVWMLVDNRMRHYESQDPFSPKHPLHLSNISHLKAFKSFLVSIDRWNHHKSLEDLLAEKEKQVQALKEEVAGLSQRLAAALEFEPAEKIRIVKGKLPTVIDLFKQLQELVLADGTKVFNCQTQSPWYKMLARYFDHGENSISVETLRNYFPAKKNTKLIKGSSVAEDEKVFRIVHSRSV